METTTYRNYILVSTTVNFPILSFPSGNAYSESLGPFCDSSKPMFPVTTLSNESLYVSEDATRRSGTPGCNLPLSSHPQPPSAVMEIVRFLVIRHDSGEGEAEGTLDHPLTTHQSHSHLPRDFSALEPKALHSHNKSHLMTGTGRKKVINTSIDSNYSS